MVCDVVVERLLIQHCSIFALVLLDGFPKGSKPRREMTVKILTDAEYPGLEL